MVSFLEHYFQVCFLVTYSIGVIQCNKAYWMILIISCTCMWYILIILKWWLVIGVQIHSTKGLYYGNLYTTQGLSQRLSVCFHCGLLLHVSAWSWTLGGLNYLTSCLISFLSCATRNECFDLYFRFLWVCMKFIIFFQDISIVYWPVVDVLTLYMYYILVLYLYLWSGCICWVSFN